MKIVLWAKKIVIYDLLNDRLIMMLRALDGDARRCNTNQQQFVPSKRVPVGITTDGHANLARTFRLGAKFFLSFLPIKLKLPWRTMS